MRNLYRRISSIVVVLFLLNVSEQQSVQISNNSACNSASAQPLIQTGTFTLTRQPSITSRVTTFQIVVNYVIPSSGISVAVSTGRINGYNQAVGTDFSIRGGRVNQTNQVNFVLLINNDISWASVQASFIFSSRSDLLIGSFLPDTQALFSNGGNLMNAQNQVVNWAPVIGNVNFALVISGLRTADNFFSFSFTQANFNQQSGVFTVQLTTDANPSLELIIITYIIVFPTAPFTFLQYNPLLSTPSATFTFQAIDSIAGNSITYEGYAMNFTGSTNSTIPCIGTNCLSACIESTRCTQLNGLIVLGQCFLCGFQEFYSNSQCLPRCTVNQTWNGISCSCRPGYTRVNSTCRNITCPSTSTWNGQQCVCANGNLFSRNQCLPRCGNFENAVIFQGVCVCIEGFDVVNGLCVRTSQCNRQNQIIVNGLCACRSGFQYNSLGVCIANCLTNQILIGQRCQCVNGFVRDSFGVCVSICRVNEIYDNGIRGCVCRQGYGLSLVTSLCDICPANSRSTGLLTACVCNSGFYLDGQECKRTIACPARSTWDAIRLVCVCTTNGEFLINGTCQPCQSNSAWNGSQCVCRTGFFLISGVCTQCSSNSQFIQGQCVCNFGFFGNGLVCSACHPSCGTCSSNLSNNCLTCANASYVFSNGVCSLRQCDSGSFFNSSSQTCQKCIDYCAACLDSLTCDTCITGFEVLRQNVPPLTIISCIETCGDGRKFYDQCDDGNNINGDGCNSTCKVQSGWTCVGGNTTDRSLCFNILPSASKLITNGHVILQGEVLQGMSMTYLPQNLTSNGCPSCSSILNVSVLSTPIIPMVTVTYIAATQYKFLVRFNFNNIVGSFVFNFTVRISSAFASFFTQADMDQVQVVRIDMALLSTVEATSQLAFNNLQINQPSPTNKSRPKNQTNIVIPGVPRQAVLIMFGSNS